MGRLQYRCKLHWPKTEHVKGAHGAHESMSVKVGDIIKSKETNTEARIISIDPERTDYEVEIVLLKVSVASHYKVGDKRRMRMSALERMWSVL